MSWTAVTPSSARWGIFRATSRNVPPLRGRFGVIERADVKLVDHEVVKSRRDESALVPGKIGLADDAVARERRLELARVRIALWALAALADHVEHVAVAIADPGDEAAPMAVVVARQEACVVASRRH